MPRLRRNKFYTYILNDTLYIEKYIGKTPFGHCFHNSFGEATYFGKNKLKAAKPLLCKKLK